MASKKPTGRPVRAKGTRLCITAAAVMFFASVLAFVCTIAAPGANDSQDVAIALLGDSQGAHLVTRHLAEQSGAAGDSLSQVSGRIAEVVGPDDITSHGTVLPNVLSEAGVHSAGPLTALPYATVFDTIDAAALRAAWWLLASAATCAAMGLTVGPGRLAALRALSRCAFVAAGGEVALWLLCPIVAGLLLGDLGVVLAAGVQSDGVWLSLLLGVLLASGAGLRLIEFVCSFLVPVTHRPLVPRPARAVRRKLSEARHSVQLRGPRSP